MTFPQRAYRRRRLARDKNVIVSSTIDNRETARTANRIFCGFAGGFALGYQQTLNEYAERDYTRKYGLTTFPKLDYDDIRRPFSVVGVNDDENERRSSLAKRCRQSPPFACSTDADCDTLCGGGGAFVCTAERRIEDGDLIFNGVNVRKKSSDTVASVGRCVPAPTFSMFCAPGLGRAIVSYDAIADRLTYKCVCAFPDLFAGESCDTFVGCVVVAAADKTSETRRAKLVDRTTGLRVDVSNADSLKNLNFYELDARGRPRYYCECKKIDRRYTSGLNCFRCYLDVCLTTLRSDIDKTNENVVGLADGDFGTDAHTGQLNCVCGNPDKTSKIVHNPAFPCKNISQPRSCRSLFYQRRYKFDEYLLNPQTIKRLGLRDTDTRLTIDYTLLSLVDSSNSYANELVAPSADRMKLGNLDNKLIDTTDVFRRAQACECADANHVFLPCRNAFRNDPTLPSCETWGIYMVDPQAVEAGVCANVCKHCNLIARQTRPFVERKYATSSDVALSSSDETAARIYAKEEKLSGSEFTYRTDLCQPETNTISYCVAKFTTSDVALENPALRSSFACQCFSTGEDVPNRVSIDDDRCSY